MIVAKTLPIILGKIHQQYQNYHNKSYDVRKKEIIKEV
jgi:hypothetical protein